MRKKYICILVAVIGVCSLSGCGSSAKKTEEEQVTIGVENRYPGDGSFSYRFL